jgi:methylmalonyl-CoA carboxyltransferase 12S subunit
MKTDAVDWARAVEGLEALRRELARLGERVSALEAAVGVAPRAAPAPPPAPPVPRDEGLSEELVLVISAAIAAFLGKRPHVRQIRLLGSAAWSQQGRITVQASHHLGVQHR